MKRVIYLAFTVALMSLGLISCLPEEESFDESLLAGKWVSGTEYYKYNADGTGTYWDESENTEEYAKRFTWTLEKSDFTHIYIMETDDYGVPQRYTLKELSPTTLVYEDDFDSYHFTRADKN